MSFKKTSDRMAVYKANARKSAARQPSVPARVSPRTSPPRGCSPAGEKAVTNSRTVDRISQDNPPFLRREPRGSEHVLPFDDLEEILETSPRPARSAGKKRDSTSMLGTPSGTSGANSESGDEMDKTSKKRKTCKTPPRGQGSAARTEQFYISNKKNTSPSTPRTETQFNSGSDSELLHVSDVGDSPCVERASSSPITKDDIFNHRRNSSRERGRTLVYPSGALRGHTVGRVTDSESRAGSPADRNGDLNVLRVSSATVSRLLDCFGSKLKSELSVMQKANVEEMRRIADSVIISVSSQMKHMEDLVSMATRGMTGVRYQKNGGKTNLTEWEQKLNSLTGDVDIIFNKDVLGRILCFNTSVKVTSVYRSVEGDDVEKAALSAKTLLFSLQPGERKFSFSGKVGALHSEFKFTMVHNSFFNVSRNSFGFFSDREDTSQDNPSSTPTYASIATGEKLNQSDSRSFVGSTCIKRPIWLQPGKVNSDHINEARGFLERSHQSRKNKIRQTPGPDDIGIHAALRVYRLLGYYLHVRRGAVRNKFFQCLGYLFVRWTDHVEDNDQTTLKMSWNSGDPSLKLRLDSVPYTEQCNINADDAAITAVDVSNHNTLRQLFSRYPGMVLAVEHQVHVVNGNGTQRRHVGGEVTTVHHLINLIDVASDVCVEYCGVNSLGVFLRTHRYSLQCVMIIALLLKAFCVRGMENRDKTSSRAAEVGRDDTDSIDPVEAERPHPRSEYAKELVRVQVLADDMRLV